MLLSFLQLHALLALPAVLAWLAARTYRQYRRLSHVPGPRIAGFSRWWFARSTLSGRIHLDLYDVCKRYGSLARVSPNDLVTSDPGLAKRMLAVRSPYTRSDWYNGLRFEPRVNSIVSVRDDSLHGVMRAQMASGYSGKQVDNLEQKIDDAVVGLVALVEAYIARDEPLDMARKVLYFTLDVISDLAFGEPLGHLSSDSDVHRYVHDMETHLPVLIISTVASWVIPLLGLAIFRPVMPSEHDVLGVGRIMGIAKRVAAERYGPGKKVQRDMVGSFVAHGLTQAQTSSEIATQITAGSDTTATGIRATLLHITTSPRVHARIQDEIARTRLSRPVATDAEIRAMPYLQAAIKEGLRVFPPVSGFMSKEVPPAGDSWNGVALPPGTRVGLCTWGILRRREVWGDDADEFRPERWLDAGRDQRRQMEGVLDLVFGAGKWACLGRNVALMAMNKALVELLRRFDLAVVNPTQPWTSVNCGIFIQSGFWVRATRRAMP
ncbi:uncharacterized protein UV8b_05885 [Ustilaginoidea virens]|uniref:Pisatin demethylase n=1 Tax=Ustilaginoidea virens TaxID=1159556 RepID=A0A8E5HUA3_USTVR|nr:uncharacterized protein UV8b_05885 [Ustilaginoidea virens]QUC21642.1 hypothetical protein UV8b_05885 [Ustilaginoidea virens]